MRRGRELASLVVAAVLCGGACTGTGGSAAGRRTSLGGGPAALRGTVAYEARLPTPRGASARAQLRPARFVSVVLLDEGRDELGRATTDAEGRFDVSLRRPAAFVVVESRAGEGEGSVLVSVDQGGRRPHAVEVPVSAGESEVVVTARDDDPSGAAGAFHIVDTLLRGLEATARWTGRRLPPIQVWWGRGVTRSWSYYRGEQPPGSGRYALELLGGQPGQQATSDTDEHDEAIVLHELGHMVMDLVSTDSSPGGHHPPGVLVDPGLAWEEGRVTWFATAVLADPAYRDTIGVEPEGKLRVDRNLETVNPGPQGNGSEQTVAEVLWDLADGAEELPDEDDDGVALGGRGLMAAMVELAELEGAYPSLSSFLCHLVSNRVVSERALKAMLARGGQPASLARCEGEARWPIPLAVPGRARGVIDGVSDPAPSGGPPRPETGFDATRAYRFRLPEPARVSVTLDIDGSGRASDRQDLDLELRDIRARLIGHSRSEERTETIARELPAGHFVVYVRDGGAGNRARYELRIERR